MLSGVLWKGRFGRWNAGIYTPIRFSSELSYDEEWDSAYDSSSFQAVFLGGPEKEARAFLTVHGAELVEVVLDDGFRKRRLSFLANLAKKR